MPCRGGEGISYEVVLTTLLRLQLRVISGWGRHEGELAVTSVFVHGLAVVVVTVNDLVDPPAQGVLEGMRRP